MKRIFNIILLFLAVASFTSCNNDPIMFDESMSFVAFTTKTATTSEVNQTLEIPVLVTAMSGSAAIDVTYTISTEGHKNPAVIDSDFKVLSTDKLSYAEGYGYNNIVIETIDNDKFTGTKTFSIILSSNSLNYAFGALDTITVNISDDDHPLGWMLGSYDAAITATANGDLAYGISLEPIEGETSKIKIFGMSGVKYGAPLADPYYLEGVVNEEFTELKIKAEQEWDSWGYGPTTLKVWEDDNGEGAETGELIGEITNDNGAITITFRQQYTFYITDGNNAGLGLQWAWNEDAAPNSPTAIWTRK